MYQTKKFSTTNLVPHRGGPEQPMTYVHGSSIGLSNDAGDISARVSAVSTKQRLRWTSELHDRFVEAVTQLGGPESKFSSCICIFFAVGLNLGGVYVLYIKHTYVPRIDKWISKK